MLGLAKVKGTVKILLDLDRVLGADGRGASRDAPRTVGMRLRRTLRPTSGRPRSRDARAVSAIVRLVYEEPASRCTRASGR